MEVARIFERFRALRRGIRIPMRSTSTWFGEHRSAFQGAGFETTGIDEWRPGQPLKDVSWRLSLRTYPDRLFRIERLEPRQVPLLLVVDLSRSMLFELSRDSNKALMLLDLVGALGLTRARLHDPVGLLAFSDRIELFLKPTLGTGQVFRAAHEIAQKLQLARERPSARTADLSVALRFVIARLKTRCSIAIISDFIDVMDEDRSLDVALLRRVASKHDVTALVLDDPGEFERLGRVGYLRIADMESGRQTVVARRRARLIRRDIDAATVELRATLKRECGIDSEVLTPGRHLEALFRFLTSGRTS